MAEIKTKKTEADVKEFINSFAETEQRRNDSFELLKLMQDFTGYEPKMWGPSIIGFGSYHYVYESGHSGDAPLVGFSPRKAKTSLYFATGDSEREESLKQLGKHTAGKSCVYINKLEDIDTDVLKAIILQSIAFLENLYPSKK